MFRDWRAKMQTLWEMTFCKVSFAEKAEKSCWFSTNLSQQRITSTTVGDSFNLQMRIFKDLLGGCCLENMLFSCLVLPTFLVPAIVIFQDERDNVCIFGSLYWLLASKGPITMLRVIMQYSLILFSWTELYGWLTVYESFWAFYLPKEIVHLWLKILCTNLKLLECLVNRYWFLDWSGIGAFTYSYPFSVKFFGKWTKIRLMEFWLGFFALKYIEMEKSKVYLQQIFPVVISPQGSFCVTIDSKWSYLKQVWIRHIRHGFLWLNPCYHIQTFKINID